jgi:hypothetical protein
LAIAAVIDVAVHARPALTEIERTFSAALGRIVISDMIKLAKALK